MTEPELLFDSIHGGRPERLAQLVFAHALRTQKPLCKHLGIPEGANATVLVEQYVDETVRAGWRTDVTVKSNDAPAVRVELKISAHLSLEQKKALANGEVDIIIAPSHRKERLAEEVEKAGCHARVFSWLDVAEQVAGDVPTMTLLRQADGLDSWLLEKAPTPDVERELAAYFDNGTDAAWRQVYRFLSTLDLRLKERAPSYRPGGWSHSRKREYYGFGFFFGEAHNASYWWVGFERKGARVELAVYKNNDSLCSIAPFLVDDAMREILGHAGLAGSR